MIKASATDLDWYVVDEAEILKRLQGVPAMRLRRGQWQIHRSHLPLLTNVRQSLDLLTPVKADLAAREQRDRETEANGFKLRWYQHDAVDFIRARKGTLLADDMRVGKTLSSLAAHQPETGPLLVVCPLIAREVWRRWIEKLWPGEDIGVLMGTTYDPAQARKPIVLCHYDILTHWQHPERWGLAIFDEAHVLSSKGRPSKRALAAGLQASWAKRVVAATGTPVWNRPFGMYGILALIAPYAFGPPNLFGARYCGPVSTAYGMTYPGTSNTEELSARLSAIRLRREWRDVQANLPAVTRDIAIADVSMAQARAIDIAVAQVLSESDKGGATVARFRRALGAAKVKPTLEAARKVLEAGEPTVIWAWHKDTARKIAAGLEGHETFLIHGSVPPAKREELFTSWRQSAGALVLTIATGQVGIDLSHSRFPIFAEVDWTPALIRQAEMRTYDPTRPMHVTYVVSDHLVERRMVMALQSKLASAAPIGAAVGAEAIDILLTAFNVDTQSPDMQRLAADLLSCEFVE